MSINGGSVSTGTPKVYAGDGNVTLFIGNLTLTSIDTSGSPSGFSYFGGNLTVGSGLVIDPSGPMGSSLFIPPNFSSITILNNNFSVASTANASVTQAGNVNVGQTGVANENLNISGSVNSVGNYTLEGSGTLNVSGAINVGLSGVGNFVQSGGTCNTNLSLNVGSRPPGTIS